MCAPHCTNEKGSYFKVPDLAFLYILFLFDFSWHVLCLKIESLINPFWIQLFFLHPLSFSKQGTTQKAEGISCSTWSNINPFNSNHPQIPAIFLFLVYFEVDLIGRKIVRWGFLIHCLLEIWAVRFEIWSFLYCSFGTYSIYLYINQSTNSFFFLLSIFIRFLIFGIL